MDFLAVISIDHTKKWNEFDSSSLIQDVRNSFLPREKQYLFHFLELLLTQARALAQGVTVTLQVLSITSIILHSPDEWDSPFHAKLTLTEERFEP